MSQETIYQNGTAEVNVPATESIAISNYGGGIAKIYYHIITANTPPAWQFQQTLENSAVILGPFAVATIVRIDANNSKVFYDIGSSPDTGIGDADTLNGKASDTASTADTIVARNSSGFINGVAHLSTNNIFTNNQSITKSVPKLFLVDTADSLQKAFAVGAGALYIQADNVVFVDENGTNVTSLKIRIGGSDEDIYHTGNDTNLAKLNAANTFTALGNTLERGLTVGNATYDGLISGGKLATGNTQVLNTTASAIVAGNPVTQLTIQSLATPIYNVGASNYNLYHTGINPSLGSGNAITGSFTTSDAKTITVTDGIITAIV